ncbi:bis(5'nucleosyl)-tetraphosphatase, ApaH [Edwardsiella piscicida]|nr:bis(5'nucleosyl)-tetraphosphatase, ApaH [Edwardsiella piscicida]
MSTGNGAFAERGKGIAAKAQREEGVRQLRGERRDNVEREAARDDPPIRPGRIGRPQRPAYRMLAMDLANCASSAGLA